MESSFWLSVLVPMYNAEEYLEACLESVVSQAGAGVEVIVLDDCSTDQTYNLLCDYISRSSLPIRVLRNMANYGLSAARNRLLAEARGDYIWFVDADDVMVSGAVVRLQSIVAKAAPDLVMCDYQIWRPGKKQGWFKRRKESHVNSFVPFAKYQLLQDSEVLFCGLYQKHKLHSWSKIATRSLWQSGLQFPEGKYFEDMVTTPRLMLKVNSYYYCPEVWIRYRQHSSSIVAKMSPAKFDDLLSGLDGVLALWDGKLPNMKMSTRYVFIRYCINTYLYALRRYKKMGGLTSERIRLYRAQLYRNIGMDAWGLVRFYLSLGRFFSLIKPLLHRRLFWS